jgi:hypothetical protein
MESIHVLVNQGDTVISDKDVQVDFLTGDRSSTYELRWYSLRSTESGLTSTSPVGDTKRRNQACDYNPHEFSMSDHGQRW